MNDHRNRQVLQPRQRLWVYPARGWKAAMRSSTSSAVEAAGLRTLDRDQRVTYDLENDGRGRTSAVQHPGHLIERLPSLEDFKGRLTSRTGMCAMSTLQYYTERAADCRRQAEATNLANVRARCLSAASAWDDMANLFAGPRPTEKRMRRERQKPVRKPAERALRKHRNLKSHCSPSRDV